MKYLPYGTKPYYHVKELSSCVLCHELFLLDICFLEITSQYHVTFKNFQKGKGNTVCEYIFVFRNNDFTN